MRISKILAVCLPINKIAAEQSYLLQRFYDTDISWRQITSSPQSHLISNYKITALRALSHYVDSLQGRNNQNFKIETAKQGVIDLWKLEISLLETIPNYISLEKELDLGEIWEPRYTVTFDYLAHYTVCLLRHDSKWMKYIIDNYPHELDLLKKMNSWVIDELGYQYAELSDDERDDLLAERLFLGHKDLYLKLKELYNH